MNFMDYVHQEKDGEVTLKIFRTIVLENTIFGIGIRITPVDKVGIICKYDRESHRFDQNEFPINASVTRGDVGPIWADSTRIKFHYHFNGKLNEFEVDQQTLTVLQC